MSSRFQIGDISMTRHFPLIITAFALATAAFGAIPDDAYQVGYLANFTHGDSFVNLTNAGSVTGGGLDNPICANVYVLAEDQQLIGCCACPLTANHLKTLSAKNDLISNTLTPGVPQAVTVALQANKSAVCNAATVTTASLVPGLRAWSVTLHALPSGAGYTVTEPAFQKATIGADEFTKLTSYCGFIQVIGSGYGICRSCRTGASGAAKQ